MALVARAEPGTTIFIGPNNTFQFDEDGRRQVSNAEAELLRNYDGPVKVTIEEAKTTKGGK